MHMHIYNIYIYILTQYVYCIVYCLLLIVLTHALLSVTYVEKNSIKILSDFLTYTTNAFFLNDSVDYLLSATSFDYQLY